MKFVQDEYPVYEKHNQVECFNCEKPLKNEDHEATGYPKGKYRKFCECMYFTYYNINAN
jgi:hypothetical protein